MTSNDHRWRTSRNVRRLLGSSLILAFLSACAGGVEDLTQVLDGEAWNTSGLEALSLSDDPYRAALQTGYTARAMRERTDFSWSDAALFVKRAKQTAAGETVLPLLPAEFGVTSDDNSEIVEGREVLTRLAQAPGPLKRAGRQIGEAQVFLDCAILEIAERFDDEKTGNCTEQFLGTLQLVLDLAALPDNMAVVLPKDGETGGIELTSSGGDKVSLDAPFAASSLGASLDDLPVDEAEIRDAFAASLGAQPPPPATFIIYFEFNETLVSDEMHPTIQQAVEEARRRTGAEFLVTAFTDGLGQRRDRIAIANERASNVAKTIVNEFRSSEKVDIRFRGREPPEALSQLPREQQRQAIILVR